MAGLTSSLTKHLSQICIASNSTDTELQTGVWGNVRVRGLTIKLLLSRINLLLEARGQEEVRGFVNSN